ncbi:NmrA family transcriptional regulator [Actinomadura craniellae]|uniref:NmrA family transcriptional regulator n=1 Tax=Actinomadura craniellae TaxID=2231787 RepID=A0A365HC10_9ACTN|nr:NmrA family transcriptional regulator [Actinomadura craniellae]
MTAASGALGGLVLQELQNLPAGPVRPTARRPRRPEEVRADYDDPASMREAFAGADRLLLISSPELDPARRLRQHLDALEAARRAGVKSVVYTSFLGADTDPTGLTEAHHATEQALIGGDLPYTVLRNPFYSEAFLPPAAARGVTSGTGGRGLNTAFRADLARAAATVLTEDGHLGRAYDLTGPLWTFPGLAAALGLPYREQEPPGALGWLHAQVRSGRYERQTGDLERLLGRPPTPITR